MQLLDAAAAAAKPGEDGEAAKPEIPELKWIHVATEGSYKGHADGSFALTRQVFSEFVTAFRADPRYKAGADGVGTNPVIPFDYEHVSEMDPREGSVPQGGAPAPAWALDLKVVDGEDAKANLYAYAKLGETIRQQMSKDEYRFVSIAFALETTDPVSGKPAGPRLTSIAFTNHPFLRDLTPLAASSRGLRNYYGEQAASPEEAFEFTRCILGLPAATTNAEVLTELAKIVAWAESPATVPAGVDVVEAMKDLRRAWGVAITNTPAELLEMANKAAAALAQPAAPAPALPPTVTETSPATAATAPKESSVMSDNLQVKLVSLLKSSKRYGSIVTLDSEEAVTEAVGGALKDSAALGELLKALGYESAASALSGIPDLLAAKAKLAAALAELEEATSMQAQIDEAAEAADVGAAMSSKGYGEDDQLKRALTAHRSSVIAEELKKAGDKASPKQLSEARRAGRRNFLSSYGVAPEGMETLLTSLVAGPGGVQLRPPAAHESRGGAPNGAGGRLLSIKSNGSGGPRSISLAGVRGVNRFDRMTTWVKNNEAGADKWSWDAICKRSNELLNDRNVSVEDPAA